MTRSLVSSSVPAPAKERGAALVAGLSTLTGWLVLLIFVALPLDFYIVTSASQTGVFFSQALAAEAVIICALALAAAALFRRPLPFLMSWRALLPLAAVLLVGLASSAGATNQAEAIKGCFKVFVYVGLFALAAAVRSIPAVRRSALQAVILALCIVLFVGPLGTNPGVPDIAGLVLNIQRAPATLPGSLTLRAEATFRYPTELAAYLLVVLPFVIACAVKAPGRVERFAYWVMAGIGIWLLVLTYTRGAVVAFFVVLPLLLFLVGGWRYCLAGLALMLAAAAFLLTGGGALHDRLLSVLNPADSGYTTRQAIWEWAWHAFQTHPIFGVGLDNLKLQPDAPLANAWQRQRATDAEDLYLNTAAELGIVGLVAVLACFVGALRRSLNGLRWGGSWLDQCWNAATVSALCAILLYGLVDPVLVSGQVTGLLCILVGLSGGGVITPVLAGRAGGHPARALTLPKLDLGDAGMQHAAGQVPHLESRVVFLVNSSGIGGAERHALHLAEDLRARGNAVLVVCPPGAPIILQLTQKGIPYREIELGMSAGRWRGYLGTLAYLNPLGRAAFHRAIARLAAETPSVFICPFLREQLLAARPDKRRDWHAVWVVHSPLHYTPHRLLLHGLFVRRARHADAIVAVSRRLADDLAAGGIERDRIYVIPNSVAGVPAAPARAVMPAANPGRAVTIGVASRLMKAKGLQHLVAALPIILQRYPNTQLFIAGSGRYERALRDRVRRLNLDGHVTFLGYVADPMAMLHGVDIFVYPSADPGEVLPTAILEAMSAGVPVVASDVGSLPEVVSNEQTGILTPAGDSAALAHAVLDLLDNPPFAATLAESGRALVQSRYTRERTSPQFLRLLAFVEQDAPATQSSGNTSGLVQAVHRVRFLNNTAILLASKVLTALATALWTILAGRVLLPTAYGDLMLTMGLVELGAIITDAGLTSIAARELAQARGEQARTLIGTLIGLKLILGILAADVVILVAVLMPFGADVRWLTIVLGPSLLFVALNSLTLVFRARMSAGYVLGVSFTAAVFSTYGAVFVYWFAPDAENFVWIRLLAAVLGGVLALGLILLKYRPHLKPSVVVARRLLIASAPLGLALALNVLYYRIDVPLLALLAGSTEVAVYTAAYRILDVFTLVPGAAAAMAVPIMSAIGLQHRRQLAAFATQYLELAVACGLFVGVGVTLFAGPLLHFLYAGRYDASAPTLIVLGWVAAATLVTTVFAPITIALERQRALLVATAIGLAANLGLNAVLIPGWGALGAAYATLVTEFAVSLPLIGLARRSTHMRLVTRPILASVAATLAALAAYLLVPPATWSEWPARLVILAVWALVLIGMAPRWAVGLVASSWKTTARFQDSVSLPAVRPDTAGAASGRRDTP